MGMVLNHRVRGFLCFAIECLICLETPLPNHLPLPPLFLFSELSNTVWAFATAGIRGDTLVELIKFMADALDEGDGGFFGFQFKRMSHGSTLCVYCSLYSLLANVVAHHIACSISYTPCLIAQELSNTAWALATLHSKRSPGTSLEAMEDDGIVRVLRWVAKSLLSRTDDFKPQEISNR